MLLQAVAQEAPNNHLTRKQWFVLDNTENVGAAKCMKQLQVTMKYEPTRNQHFLF
jgi:hypothetical protein